MPGKWLLKRVANFLSRTKIPDLNSGLRALRRDVIEAVYDALAMSRDRAEEDPDGRDIWW